VAHGDLGRPDGERRVDHRVDVRDASGTREFGEDRENVLRAPERERRYDEIAVPAMDRVVDRGDELVERFRHAAVIAVAIGGLDHQHVCGSDGCRVAHDRALRLAEVAGEHELGGRAFFADPELGDRRAEDVACVLEPRTHPRMRNELAAVGCRLEECGGARGIGNGVERQSLCLLLVVPAGLTAVVRAVALAARLALHDVGAVFEHQRRQIRGRRGAPDFSAKARRNEARQQPAVVEVRVREDDEVERLGPAARWRAVLRAGFAATLEKPAVDEEAHALGLDQRGRTRHFGRGAEEGESHR